MKNLLLAIALLLGTLNPSFAASIATKNAATNAATNATTNATTNAFKNFKSRFHSPAFSDIKLSKKEGLELLATDLYVSSGSARQKAWVAEVIQGLRETKDDKLTKGLPQDQLVSVTWSGGGELWHAQSDKLTKVGEWSDNQLYFSETSSSQGRLFAFFGGQIVQGGDVDVTGFTARIGSTLLKNRYDLAATLSYASINSTPSVKINSLGVVGRALFPLSEHVGYNLGGQFVRTEIDGKSELTPGAVAGLNFFNPAGSFDLTLSATDAGRWSLLAGYTLFFDRQ